MPVALIPEDFIARARASESWTLEDDGACEDVLEALEGFGVTRIQYDGEGLKTSDPYVAVPVASGSRPVFDALETLPHMVAGVVTN